MAEWEYIDDEPAKKPKASWSYVEDDIPSAVVPEQSSDTTDLDAIKMMSKPGIGYSPSTGATGMVGRAFDESVGDRIGIDTNNQEAIKKWTGVLYPFANAGAAVNDLVTSLPHMGIAGANQVYGNLFNQNEGDIERRSASQRELLDIGSLFAGGQAASVGRRLPPAAEGEYVNLLKTGSADDIRSYLQKNGFDADEVGVDDWVANRDKPGAKPEAVYADPKTDAPADQSPVDTISPDPSPTEDVVTRFTNALNNAGKVREEQQALYSQARSERLGKIRGVQDSTAGEAGYRAELSQLRGELPKADFEGVREQFSQGDVDELFDSIKNNTKLSMFDQINARTGLAKLLDGQLPTTSELKLLGETFPNDFVKAALKHRKLSVKLLDATGNALNLPRSIMSSLDLSAPLRQGVFLVGRKEFWKSFGSMFKQLGSEKAFNGVMDDIKGRETFPLMEESGLSLSDLSYDLSAREEAFMSRWAEKIPGVRASERAYTGFLNKLRADVFDDLVKKSKEAGIDLESNPKALGDIASFVNNATGRGSLGKLNAAAPVLNGLFFSPRLMASRVNLLNPAYYVSLSPVVRKEAIKSLLSFGGIASTVTALAKAGGADVESDPRSSDFAKIKIGNTRYDIGGGFNQYLTLAARLATNETKTLKGKVKEFGIGYKPDTRFTITERFLRSKASPLASLVADYMDDKNVIGEPFEAKKAVAERFVPMFWQDAYDVINENGAAGIPMAAPGIFGVGTQTFDENAPRPKKETKSEWKYVND